MKHHPAGLPSWADDTLRDRFGADQQDAVAEDAAAAAAFMLSATGSTVVAHRARMNRLDQQVYDRFARFLRDDPDAQFCHHVGTDPQLFWYLSPGCPLACAACIAGWLTEHVAGTDENTRCDICGAAPLAERDCFRGVIVVPLVYRAPVPPGQPPPVTTVTYWACPGCAAEAVP